MTDLWAVVHDEREALAADLEHLDAGLWETPSLCAGWTVHDVLAHLVATAKDTVTSFVRDMVRARGDFDRANALGVTREKAEDPAETLSRFRAVAHRTSSPPVPRVTRLIEAVVHGEDIRRPLGLARDYPPEAVASALRSQAGTSAAMGGGKALVAGLSLAATDTELTFGTGQRVAGAAVDLLLASSGRAAALPRLGGPGLETLARRIDGVSS